MITTAILPRVLLIFLLLNGYTYLTNAQVLNTRSSSTHEYFLLNISLNFFEGREECRKSLPRGTLVKPVNKPETDFVQNFANDINLGVYHIDYIRDGSALSSSPASYRLPSDFGQVRDEFPWGGNKPFFTETGSRCIVQGNVAVTQWSNNNCFANRQILCQRELFSVEASTSLQDMRYTLVEGAHFSIEDATDTCNQLNPPGTPASFVNEEEHSVLVEMLNKTVQTNTLDYFWIGLRRFGDVNGKGADAFTFLDGRNNSFARVDGIFPWNENEPQGSNLGEEEECALVSNGLFGAGIGKLMDAPCDVSDSPVFRNNILRGGVLCLQTNINNGSNLSYAFITFVLFSWSFVLIGFCFLLFFKEMERDKIMKQLSSRIYMEIEPYN